MMGGGSKKRLLIVALAAASAALLFFGFGMTRAYLRESRDAAALKEARTLFADKHMARAFTLIRQRNRTVSAHSEEWLNLEIETLVRLGNVERLRSLYELHRPAFGHHEEASLLLARLFIRTKNREAYQALRNDWRAGQIRQEAWYALDVDALLAEGDVQGALKLLHSRSFDGEADAGRLSRLAILAARKNLQQAWGYLADAYRVAPKNPDVRSFRAQILERMGKLAVARVEYVAAYLAAPTNPRYRDQLAEFYRRHGWYKEAVATWSKEFSGDPAAFIQIKAHFWSKVATPARVASVDEHDLFGDLAPFALYLQELPVGEFWNDALFATIPAGQLIVEQRQEAYWLRLLQALKSGKEQQAYALLLSHPFRRNSWNPELELALERLLAFRLGQTAPISEKGFFAAGANKGRRHQFFDRLEELAATGVAAPSLKPLLLSDEAFAAAFMAGGWIEAALQLHKLERAPATFPDWFAYGMTQSIRLNRGAKEALAFAGKQPGSAALDLLTGELLLADSQTAKAGMARLAPLVGQNNDIGYRAAWLVTIASLNGNDPANAKATLARQPRLCNSRTGKELQARIALAEGDAPTARSIYESLSKVSPEAMAYLAKTAYQEQDWQSARAMNAALLQLYPDRLELRANFKTISAAEAKAGEQKP